MWLCLIIEDQHRHDSMPPARFTTASGEPVKLHGSNARTEGKLL